MVLAAEQRKADIRCRFWAKPICLQFHCLGVLASSLLRFPINSQFLGVLAVREGIKPENRGFNETNDALWFVQICPSDVGPYAHERSEYV